MTVINGIRITLRNSTNTIKLARNISNSSTCKQQNESEGTGSFTPVYKFPYIMPISLINRLKAYQTVLTVLGIPTSILLNHLNYVASDAILCTASFGISGCIALYSLGYLTKNFIGFIYYNEEKDIFKISYMDFWGKRKDIEVPTKDIVPINELPITPFDGLYLTFRRFTTKDTLKLNLQFGVILDKEKIKQVL